MNSSSSSITDQSTPLLVTEEFDSWAGENAYYEGERGPLGDVEFSRNKLCKKNNGNVLFDGEKNSLTA